MDDITLRDTVIRSLEAIPLTPDQIEGVVDKLVKHASFFNAQNNGIAQTSPYWDFKNKIRTASRLLNIDETIYAEALLKRPQLFAYLPTTVHSNIEGAARLIGVAKSDYTRAALKQPQLFIQSPETIHKNFLYIQTAKNSGYIRTNNFLTDVLNYPTCLSCATTNTHLRAVEAHVTQRSWRLTHYFTGTNRDKKTVEATVVEHFRDMFNRTGQGIRSLHILAEKGVISGLPDWVPTLETPLRQKNRALQTPELAAA